MHKVENIYTILKKLVVFEEKYSSKFLEWSYR